MKEMKLTKYPGNPILKPNPGNKWESLVVCNPGAWYEDGKFYMLYRAAGADEEHVIRLGLAESEDGFNFRRVSDRPVFEPIRDNFDGGGVEDPRIVKFDDSYYVTYAFRPYPPGQYWKFSHDVVKVPKNTGENAPMYIRLNLGGTALASTRDFRTWKRFGRITCPCLDDRDVILFPEKINGKFVLMHRPKQYVGGTFGVKYPSIWLKFSDDILCWEDKESHLLLAGRENTWEEKLGGSAPPLKTDKGWLMLYHGVEDEGLGYYRVGCLLLDLENPLHILGKTPDYILEPEFDYEIEGYYKGCVFPTGNVIKDGTLYVYYGGADKYVGVATAEVDELVEYLLAHPYKNGER